MANFSEEYYIKEGFNLPGDFSIIEIFQRLKNGESSIEICEGLGITEIINKNDICWIRYKDEEMIFTEFLLKNR